jgi:hypothetical protein
VERQLEARRENSRTISASMKGRWDSWSSRFVPTLPMCG